MDIYSSLAATLVVSLVAAPVMATVESAKRPPCGLLTSPIAASNKFLSPASAAININTANLETLVAELKGIGVKRARAIIAYRKEHGPFKSIEELTQVKGIGKKILDKNRGRILV